MDLWLDFTEKLVVVFCVSVSKVFIFGLTQNIGNHNHKTKHRSSGSDSVQNAIIQLPFFIQVTVLLFRMII